MVCESETLRFGGNVRRFEDMYSDDEVLEEFGGVILRHAQGLMTIFNVVRATEVFVLLSACGTGGRLCLSNF